MQLAENVVVAGRFRLNHRIGKGGMGSVWHATHLGLDSPCAVKFIEGEFASLPEAQARFEREAKAAAKLAGHPNVVQMLDHGIWESTPYIAMELLEGEDFGKRLQKVGVLSPAEVSTIVQQVCRALTKAHAAGIVHRDLKPDNIFLVRDDDREIVKVLDFGIAKKNSTGLDTGNNTKTGAMLGTPYYMSPEQAQGIKGVDSRSDLWSLAVIVFQALTGKLPFDSDALGDLLVKIIVAPIPTPSQMGKVPPQFDRWWAKAADREPARRFQTAKEFADALAEVLAPGAALTTDIMDRGQLQALGLGTAVMPPGAASGQRPPPGAIPAASAATPNPAYGSAPLHAAMQTPNPAAPAFAPMPNAPGVPQFAQTPQPDVTSAPLARTFGASGAGVPKKPNVALFAAIGGAVLLLGIVGTTVAVMSSRKNAAGGESATIATATPSVASIPSTPTASAPPTSDPAPSAVPSTTAATLAASTAAPTLAAKATPPSPTTKSGTGGAGKSSTPANGAKSGAGSGSKSGSKAPVDMGF